MSLDTELPIEDRLEFNGLRMLFTCKQDDLQCYNTCDDITGAFISCKCPLCAQVYTADMMPAAWVSPMLWKHNLPRDFPTMMPNKPKETPKKRKDILTFRQTAFERPPIEYPSETLVPLVMSRTLLGSSNASNAPAVSISSGPTMRATPEPRGGRQSMALSGQASAAPRSGSKPLSALEQGHAFENTQGVLHNKNRLALMAIREDVEATGTSVHLHLLEALLKGLSPADAERHTNRIAARMERFGAGSQTPPHPESPTSGTPEVQSKAKPAGLTPGRSKPAPAEPALRPIPEAGPGTAGTPPAPVLPTYPNTAAAPPAGPTPTSGAHYIVPAADVQRLQAYELNGVAALTARMTALELQKTQTDERILQAAAGAAALDKEFQAGQESRMTALESFRVTTEAVMSAAGTSDTPAAVTELFAKLQEDISSLAASPSRRNGGAWEAHGPPPRGTLQHQAVQEACKRAEHPVAPQRNRGFPATASQRYGHG